MAQAEMKRKTRSKVAGPQDHAKLFETAQQYLVGGVNSPVRSFKSVGGVPVFVREAKGATIYAEDGRKLVDYCLSWGAMILGHAHKEVIGAIQQAIKKGTSYGMPTDLETQLAKLIVDAIPSIEQVRLTSSGTEAVMGAVRVARAFTGRNKIIKFEGCYHGGADYLLVKAGSGASTLGIPDSLGVPPDFSKHTLVVPYNDLKKAKALFQEHAKEIAAIIVEPVAGNMGVVLPEPGFLEGLRKLCDDHKSLLILDEVITGFRLRYGGVQDLFGIRPDLTCLGKIIGGGLPLGAFGGSREVMKVLAPLGGAYQAGTLSGNPVAVTAGITTLQCLASLRPYGRLAARTRALCDEIQSTAKAQGVEISINSLGSMFTVFFTGQKVRDYTTASLQDMPSFRKFYHSLLGSGVYFSPSAFEANFLSMAHSDKDLRRTVQAVRAAFKTVSRHEVSPAKRNS